MDDEAAHEDGRPGANRQVIVGTLVVALTLGVAAWLAYGLVQRSTTDPRAAAGIEANAGGGGSGAGSRATTTRATSKGHSTTTTRAHTTTTRKGGPAATTTPGRGGTTPTTQSSATSAALWHAYSVAWRNECSLIWRNASSGKLYDPDDVGSVYTIQDCIRTLDPLFVTANVTSVPAATREGRTDAISFTAQLTLSGRLCWINPATDEILGCWVGT